MIGEEKKKRSKHAPAEMRSDKPVRRLRVDADNSTRKFVDPRLDLLHNIFILFTIILYSWRRFADYTGSLDQKIYANNYKFLDSMRENEIEKLSKAYKKTNNKEMKEKIKKELFM